MKKLPILRPGGAKFVPLGTTFMPPSDEPEEDDGAEELPVAHLPPFEPLVLWEDNTEPNLEARHRVVVVPELASKLRPHQREGVAFLFECTMGLRGFHGNGCILADDMGLGKTLMSITLLWTLLNQGFKHGESACRKVIVACPTSLVGNWDNEIRRWVGDRCITFPVKGDAKSTIRGFLNHRGKGVLIISYDQQRLNSKLFDPSKQLRTGSAGAQIICDLLICDEAHKLKNADSAIAQSLNMLPVRKRVLLSGTPMQNDLEEFFNMVNFCNPGVFGTVADFKRKYERPILKSREPDASKVECKRAAELQKELSTIVNEFILKRGNILNAQHLPPKLVQYVCCRLTAEQEQMYDALIEKKALNLISAGKEEGTLSYIRNMIKICCHPKLIHEAYLEKCKEGKKDEVLERVARMYSDSVPTPTVRDDKNRRQDANYRPGLVGKGGGRSSDEVDPGRSGKLLVLFRMMQTMRAEKKGDRIVIVSNYTSVLELIETMCSAHKWPMLRLDGGTSGVNRTKMVEQFNDPMSCCFAFLLSSKAGGCGINLIGGNRLVLFDADWNPANDKQAAGRIWREGQRKRCYIYRFMSTGSIEEKIIQRQLSKESLQNIVEDTESFAVIPQAELKNLFTRQEGTPSDTHDTLRCKRCCSVRSVEAREAIEHRKRLSPEQRAVCSEFLADFSRCVCQMALDNGGRAFPTQDLDSLAMQLANGQFNTLPDFAKRLRTLIAALDREQVEGGDEASLPPSISVDSEFIDRWSSVVPRLASLQQKTVKVDVKLDKATKKHEGSGGGGDSDEEEACDEGFVDQEGCPDDTDLKNWSHHTSVGTCDDDLLKRAMGDDETISFVFGLEVNWDLLQSKEEVEREDKELKKEQQRKDLVELNERRARERCQKETSTGEGETKDSDVNSTRKSKKKEATARAPREAKAKKPRKAADNDGGEEQVTPLSKTAQPATAQPAIQDDGSDDDSFASREKRQQLKARVAPIIDLCGDDEGGGKNHMADDGPVVFARKTGKLLKRARSSASDEDDVFADEATDVQPPLRPCTKRPLQEESLTEKENTPHSGQICKGSDSKAWICGECTYSNDAGMFSTECGMCAASP